MCPAHLFDGPLCCLRTDEHTTGHIFGASDAPDRHDQTEPNGDY